MPSTRICTERRFDVASGLRRTIFGSFVIAATATATATAQATAQVTAPTPGGITVQQLRPRIHVASGFENGNVLIVESDTGVLLVDAQSLTRVGALDRAIGRVTQRPVRLVINTHYHGDHTEGNGHFRQAGAQVVAQRQVAAQASKDTVIAAWDNWHRTPLPAGALPTRPFDDSIAFDFGGERVYVWHAPSAHTDGDAVIWLPGANVLHIGDILEVGAPPFIDLWAGGSLAGMLAALDRVLRVVNEQTAIVPGHGPVSSRADLLRYRKMLQTVGDRVAAARARAESIDDLLARRPLREWEDAMGGERRAQQLVRLVYADVERTAR